MGIYFFWVFMVAFAQNSQTITLSKIILPKEGLSFVNQKGKTITILHSGHAPLE